jgi:hypothetical protein
MIDNKANPLGALPNTLDMARLKSLGEPTHEVLSDLVHGCSPAPGTQTITAAALVFSLWQLRGRALTEHVPSMLLLDAGEAAPDPVDELSRSLVHDEGANRPKTDNNLPNAPIKPEHSQRVMADAIIERARLGEGVTEDPILRDRASALETRFINARLAGYGCGNSRPYSQAWNEHLGLITDDHDQLILRLNSAPDRVTFRQDVLGATGKLLAPDGIGSGLQWTRKSVSISGSLTPDLWDEALVRGIIELGLPILLLPHVGDGPLTIPNQPALDVIPTLWHSAPGRRATTSLPLPPVDWFEAHATDVRRRLHTLPGTGTYEFAILQVLHQLGGVCNQIAHFAADSEASPEHVSALFWDLHTRAFRGITLGVAALAWHCPGFDPGCPREKALKALKDLRRKGAMSRSDVLRGARLNKEERDLLLERLAAEDLVRVEGKTVTALTCAEFVAALHARPELPHAANFRALVDGEGKVTA